MDIGGLDDTITQTNHRVKCYLECETHVVVLLELKCEEERVDGCMWSLMQSINLALCFKYLMRF